MSESEKEISAKELYRWNIGDDAQAVKVLSALNNIISGVRSLMSMGGLDCWVRIADDIQTCCISPEDIREICNENDLLEVEDKFVKIRALLFGEKIDYTQLNVLLEKKLLEDLEEAK